MRWIARARNSDDAPLQMPAQDHLYNGFPMDLGDIGQDGIMEELFLEAPSAERIPGQDYDIIILDERDNFRILIVRMNLILDKYGLDADLRKEFRQLLDVETGQSEGT